MVVGACHLHALEVEEGGAEVQVSVNITSAICILSLRGTTVE